MAHAFDEQTLAGVLGHMNSDHSDDNLLIVRAFGPDEDVVGARMTTFDGDGGTWQVTRASLEDTEVHVPWPGGPITERAEVRREVVALYDAACARLGIEPRPH